VGKRHKYDRYVELHCNICVIIHEIWATEETEKGVTKASYSNELRQLNGITENKLLFVIET
jgi:hypothetical protein